MLDFFTHFKIKHADLPYMLVYLAIFSAVVLTGLLVAKITTVILMAVCCIPILILLLNYHFYRSEETIAVQQQKKYQAYFSLFNFINFRHPIPYMTGWAATPELSLAIYEIVSTQKPSQIVELGSGISSLICGYALEQHGDGSLFSIDHDELYAQKTQNMLARHALDQYCTVMHAPLVRQSINNETYIWYDMANIECPSEINLLIVDGPPFKTQKKARYPALSYFYPKLATSAAIVIHDILREDESRMIEEWLQQYPEFSKEVISTEKGIAVLRR